MSTEPEIRLATVQDLPTVCLLAEDLAAIHHAAWPHVFAPAGDVARDEAYWANGIDGEDRATFLLEVGGEAAGFVSVTVATEAPSILQPVRLVRINSISVPEKWRGRGFGKRLMQAAEAWGRERRATQALLTVWAFNAPALALYEEMGYVLRSHALGKVF